MNPTPPPDRVLPGRVAVVTGGGGVIGRAIARRFAGASVRVVVGDIDADAARRSAEEAADAGTAIASRVDVRSRDSVQALMSWAVESYGRLDILVNGAGIIHADHLLDVSLDVWRDVFAVNLEGALNGIQAAAPIMAAQSPDPLTECRGKIINISSQGADFPIPTSTAYGASKRALNYLTETAAEALSGDGISCTIVHPGMVYEGLYRTVNVARAKLLDQELEDRIEHDLDETPTGRFQDPRELADVVLFVAAFRGLGLNGRTVWSEAHVA
jgi:NAD(P)-dependent dehydrogenase (short-subunit alcohol dehydrogenase family)